VIRAAAAALLAALSSALWLSLFYAAGGGPRTDFDIDPPRVITGVHPAERDRATGLTFAWTGPEAGLRLPGLDRRVPWTVTIRVRGARPDPSSDPSLTFYVDGVAIRTQPTTTAFEDMHFVVPARPERRGAVVALRSSSTFIPGPGDRRQLGVVLDSLRLAPDGLVLPPPEIVAPAMFAGAVLAAAIALLGVTSGSAVGAAVLLSAAQGAVLAHGFAPYSNLADIAARLALALGTVLTVGRWIASRCSVPLRNTAKFAAAFSAGACFLKLLVLMHPDMPIGDALFHAHRFQGVLGGNLYFTSTAPGGYAFPYAPGLYLAASPFAWLVQREMGDVFLLRIVATVADTIAGLLLYGMAARGWNDRLAGAMAVALYHLVPLSFRILTVGNLTNAFAQSLSVGALTLAASPALRVTTGGTTMALALCLGAAFLSHTSTFAILSVCGLLMAILFVWRGGPALHSPAKAIAIATGVSIVLAVALYYAHFLTTYQTELSRLGSETAVAAPDAGGRDTSTRALAVPRDLHIYLGTPLLILAATGVFDRWRRGSRDRLTLALTAWILTCGFYLIVGVLTPLDMRYYLAVIPALALLAALGASWWWHAGGVRRIAAAVLLAWIVWTGIETWWRTLV
jgi:hypothetical protein